MFWATLAVRVDQAPCILPSTVSVLVGWPLLPLLLAPAWGRVPTAVTPSVTAISFSQQSLTRVEAGLQSNKGCFGFFSCGCEGEMV